MQDYFINELSDIVLKFSNMGLKQFEAIERKPTGSIEGLSPIDISRACGHMSKKQLQILTVYSQAFLELNPNQLTLRIAKILVT